MPLPRCQHCLLPLRGAKAQRQYCCYGCALVARLVGPQENSFQAWTLLRLALGSFLAMDVMMLALLLYSGGAESGLVGTFRWIMAALATPAMALLTYPFLLGAIGEVRRRRLSLDSLIAIGALAAYFVSLANTLRGAGHVYFDTATMLPAMVTFGRLIEASAKTHTGHLLNALETMLPPTARVIEPKGERETTPALLNPGDLLRVRPGERIPADGVIVEGQTVIDDAAFTGEALPRDRRINDAVLAGTINGQGSFVMRAQRVGGQMLLSRIIEQVEQAQLARSPSERLAERLATAFTPAVLLLSAGAGTIHVLSGHAATAGLSALAVLVVACPCALGIATPLATSLAIALAARRGILIRGGDVLERAGALRRLYLDKTGTLTTGSPALAQVECYDANVTQEELLACLASVEQASQHPLAKAVLREAQTRELPLWKLAHAEPIDGGLRGRIVRGEKSREIVAGAPIAIRALLGEAGFLPAAEGIEVGWDGRIRGRVTFAEQLRPGAKQAMAELKVLGVAPAMLSGDALEPSRRIAEQLGISQVHAAATPEDKIHLLQGGVRDGSGGAVGIVGDGVNDAPALAVAEIGIALGGGTDLARQAGNIVLLSDRIEQIPWLITISRRCRRIILQNLLWAGAYNAIALTAAAMGLLHPLLAACAMFVSSLTVLGNSLRLAKD